MTLRGICVVGGEENAAQKYATKSNFASEKNSVRAKGQRDVFVFLHAGLEVRQRNEFIAKSER
jgi:hypothetical protein